MLRNIVDQRQTNWDFRLSAAKFATNNAVQSSTGATHFFLNTSARPNMPMSLLTPAPGPSPAVNEFIQLPSKAFILAKEALVAA